MVILNAELYFKYFFCVEMKTRSFKIYQERLHVHQDRCVKNYIKL